MFNKFLLRFSSRIFLNNLLLVIYEGYVKSTDVWLMHIFRIGDKFGFVRFIQFKDVDRLVRNLCTIWVGRLRLHANVARFQRPPLKIAMTKNHTNDVKKKFIGESSIVNDSSVLYNSYAGAVKLKEVNHEVEIDNKHSIVLDNSCILQRDFSLSLMGKVLDFGSLSSMKMILAKEGFDKLNLKYMGGFWILIKFCSKSDLEKFKSHVGVGSWFSVLQYASNSFIAWLDIEGVPLKAWTKNTFTKISAEWGEFYLKKIRRTIV
ncbi:hypothetical protein Tco_1157585 [Tanacetum coccineum]